MVVTEAFMPVRRSASPSRPGSTWFKGIDLDANRRHGRRLSQLAESAGLRPRVRSKVERGGPEGLSNGRITW
jgi:hypothetical protein